MTITNFRFKHICGLTIVSLLAVLLLPAGGAVRADAIDFNPSQIERYNTSITLDDNGVSITLTGEVSVHPDLPNMITRSYVLEIPNGHTLLVNYSSELDPGEGVPGDIPSFDYSALDVNISTHTGRRFSFYQDTGLESVLAGQMDTFLAEYYSGGSGAGTGSQQTGSGLGGQDSRRTLLYAYFTWLEAEGRGGREYGFRDFFNWGISDEYGEFFPHAWRLLDNLLRAPELDHANGFIRAITIRDMLAAFGEPIKQNLIIPESPDTTVMEDFRLSLTAGDFQQPPGGGGDYNWDDYWQCWNLTWTLPDCNDCCFDAWTEMMIFCQMLVWDPPAYSACTLSAGTAWAYCRILCRSANPRPGNQGMGD